MVGALMIILGLLVFGILLDNLLTAGPFERLDIQGSQSLHALAVAAPVTVVRVMQIGGFLGQWMLVLFALAIGITWWRLHAWRELSMLIAGVGGGEILFQILSNVIGRQRPRFVDPLEQLTVPGFPSGHTISSVLFYGLLLYVFVPRIRSLAWRALAILVGALLILWIAYSRVFMGDHYPTDVISGAAVGLAWAGRVYTALDLYWRRRLEEHE